MYSGPEGKNTLDDKCKTENKIIFQENNKPETKATK